MSQNWLSYITVCPLLSRLLQQPDLHFKKSLQVVIVNVLLNGLQSTLSTITVIFQELLSMLDPYAVITAAHTAAGGGRRRTLVCRFRGGLCPLSTSEGGRRLWAWTLKSVGCVVQSSSLRPIRGFCFKEGRVVSAHL